MSELTDLIRQINQLQADFDSLVKPEIGIWTAWTPTIDQNGAVAVTVTYAKYILKLGVIVVCELNVTGAGVAGNDIVIGGVPTAIQPANTGGRVTIGNGLVTNAGTAFYPGSLVAVGASDWRVASFNQNGYVGSLPNFALANGDTISFQATYERA